MRTSFENKAAGQVFRALQECDIAVEVVDARDVEGTRLPKLDRMFRDKVVIVATKADLVSGGKEREKTPDGFEIIFASARTGKGKELLLKEIRERSERIIEIKRQRKQRKREKRLAEKRKIEPTAWQRRQEERQGARLAEGPGGMGQVKPPITPELSKIIVFGIPNAGKSSLINMISGRSSAKTGFRAGVTRGPQWISLGEGILLCDSAGVIPKGSSKEELVLKSAYDAEKLLDAQETAEGLLRRILEGKGKGLEKFYGIRMTGNPQDVLLQIAKRRNFLMKGGKPDVHRAALVVLRDFQKGKFGV